VPRRSLFRITAVSWLILAAVVLWGNRGLFRTPVFEQADDAANALSIDRAKHAGEIYGNYSRFNFHHPGPAFVYAYAAGEILFEDWLGVISPRHNAHVLAGTLLQAAFLALAIGIAAVSSVNPWRAAWLLTGISLVHFAHVPGAFTLIWPPAVLIMPFALLLVSAASVAAGRTEHAVWLALASGFLLHGHIAQFLFVGGVLLAVVGVLAFRKMRGEPVPTPSTGNCAALAVVAALTVLPWIIDATRGRESNLFNIWLHIRESADDPSRPGWQAAIASTASYFCYCVQQEAWFSPGATLTCRQFFAAYGLGALVSVAGFLACGYSLLRGRASRAPSGVFQRCLAGVCALSTVLCVIWARRQDGGITFFNSLFIFGLMMAVWVIPGLTLAERASKGVMAVVLAALACAVAAGAGSYGRSPDYIGLYALGPEAEAKVPLWLSREARPQGAKLLVFPHDQWPEAVSVAAALNRRGIRFFVPGSDLGIWKELFGEDHVLKSIEESRAEGPFSWWRPGTGDINGERLVRDIGDDRAAHEPSRFPFGFDLQHPKEAFGLSRPEAGWTWTESKVVLMRLWSEPARSDVTMTIRASAVPLAAAGSQRVQFLVNGRILPEIHVTGLADYAVTVPEAAWNGGSPSGFIDLELGLPDSGRPAAQPDSDATDRRLLGICLHKLEFSLPRR
jgi:hypothetical protein